MRKVLPAVVAVFVLLSGPVVMAQTAVPTEAPAQTAQVPTANPLQQTDAPNQAPAPGETTTDNGGLSSTAILLIVLGGVALLLLVFGVAMSQRRGPGDPGPPD